MDALKKQVGGEHYKEHAIQPIQFINERRLDFAVGNVVKYLVRNKGSRLEDLEKAYHYIELAEGGNFFPKYLQKNIVKNTMKAPFFSQFKNGKKYAQIIGYAMSGNKSKAKELLRKFINSGEYSEV